MNPVWYFLNGIPQIGTLRVTNSQVLVGDGSASAPSYSFASETNTGWYRSATNVESLAINGNERYQFGNAIMRLFNDSAQITMGAASDVSLSRGAADRLDLASGDSFRLVLGTTDYANANGQLLSAFQQLSELTTIAAAATTDTTIQMPANAQIIAVSVRTTVTIPTAATYTVGDSGSAARFSTAAVSATAPSTDPGTKAGLYYNATALSVRITPNATPAANTGRVRVTIYYISVTPPTS